MRSAAKPSLRICDCFMLGMVAMQCVPINALDMVEEVSISMYSRVCNKWVMVTTTELLAR